MTDAELITVLFAMTHLAMGFRPDAVYDAVVQLQRWCTPSLYLT
jgi:hypothetical protein